MKTEKEMKNIVFKLLLLTAFAATALSCSKDSGSNPAFGDDEMYIYDNKSTIMTLKQGDQIDMDIVVSPGDGRVDCRWVLDGMVISSQKSVTYVFDAIGEFTLRFEATRGTRTIFRTFTITVVSL